MNTKPKPPQESNEGFDSQTFWRHYVASVDTPQEWSEEQPQPGRGSNRLFLFLLLFHIFLIGSVVLFNLVADRPKPVFVDNSMPKSTVTATKKAGGTERTAASAPAIPATKESDASQHVVGQGESLRTIASTFGISRDELAKMNNIDLNTQLEVGSILRVPPVKAKLAVIPAGVQPAHVDDKLFAAPSTGTFKAVEPSSKASAAKPEAVASKLPEDKTKAKPEDSPPSGKAKIAAKTEDSSSAAKSKPTEAKALVRTEPPPAAPKTTEPAKSSPPTTAKTTEPAKSAPPSVAKTTEPAKSAPPAVAKTTESPKSSPPTIAKTTEPAKSAPPAASKPSASGTSHKVKPKETFYSISRKYNVKVDDLMRLNGFSDAGKLREGLVLKVPKA